MASFADFPSSNSWISPEGSEVCYNGTPCMVVGDDTTVSDAYEGTTGAKDPPCPYDPLLHLEVELTDNYLATQPSGSPELGNDAHSVLPLDPVSFYAPPYGVSSAHDFDSSTASPVSDVSDEYTQWYGYSVDAAGATEVGYHDASHSFPLATPTSVDPSDVEFTMYLRTLSIAATPTLADCSPVGQSTYSTIANALAYPCADQPTVPPAATTFHATLPSHCCSSYPDGDKRKDSSPIARATRTHVSYGSRQHAQSHSPYPSAPVRPRGCSPKELVYTPRRNATVSPSASPPPSSESVGDQWKCPHCPYVQHNRRRAELKRHVRTHVEDTLWICCGVPLADAERAGVPLKERQKEPFNFDGGLFVGGCRKVFSRRDALGRHLRTFAGVCFGDAYAPYLRGNQE